MLQTHFQERAMLNRLYSILAISLVAGSVHANRPATNGGTKFASVYIDKINNLSWSKALPGTYSNGCVGDDGEYDASKCTFETNSDGTRQVKVADSAAARACSDLGGGARLPTEREYQSLIQKFDHATYKCHWDGTKNCHRLSGKGISDMQSIFGDMNNWFWSSVSPNDSDGAFHFYGNYGDVDNYDSRNFSLAVRCVAGR